jgi:hypothetical protein
MSQNTDLDISFVNDREYRSKPNSKAKVIADVRSAVLGGQWMNRGANTVKIWSDHS